MANEDVKELDLENMDINELARLANEQLQPRDEHGRFVAQDPPAAVSQADGVVEDPEEVDEIIYRRVIDLGDGSGAQVFEAPTLEELVEKLGTAQEHATRKIRELTQVQRAAEPVIDENEEFVLSQQFLQSPTKAFADLFKRNTGMTVEEFKQAQAKTNKLTASQEEFNVGQEFIRTQPDYFPSEKNGRKIEKWVKTEGLPFSIDSVQKAFADLSESGLLETKPQNQDATSNTDDAGNSRIANTVTAVSTVRRAASGVSSRRITPVVATTLTEEDIYNMPMEKLAELASRSKL